MIVGLVMHSLIRSCTSLSLLILRLQRPSCTAAAGELQGLDQRSRRCLALGRPADMEALEMGMRLRVRLTYFTLTD